MSANTRGLGTEVLIPIGSLIGLSGLITIGVQVLGFLRMGEWPAWSMLDPVACASPGFAAGLASELPGLVAALDWMPLGFGLVAICVACWVPALLHGPP